MYWNILTFSRYYEVNCEVQPFRDRLEEAESELRRAQEELARTMLHVQNLRSDLKKLKQALEEATLAKLEANEKAQDMSIKLASAQRLIASLEGEVLEYPTGGIFCPGMSLPTEYFVLECPH